MTLAYDIPLVEGHVLNSAYSDDRATTYDLEDASMTAASLIGNRSRYAASRLLLYRSGATSFFVLQPPAPVSAGGGSRYFEVTPATQYRPDRIAHLVYGDSTLWWFVLAANQLIDFEQVVAGMTLRLPNSP